MHAGYSSVANDHGLLVGKLDASIGEALLLVHIAPGCNSEEAEVDGAHDCKQPIEVVEPPVVNIVSEPTTGAAWAVPGDLMHDGNYE